MTIRLLDPATINQIAAGEVVERPASIVKELVENAIDAEASSVQIEIREGGIRYIRVTDNGNGIAADQVRTAFLRHSTSKIRSAEDLSHIASLGFRGEALASIAAVARVEVLTRTPGALTGIRYVIEGGEEQRMEEVACPVGTTFRVENLFFNTPVRKKFLKKPQTEASYVTEYVQRIVLGHPEVSFQYSKEGKEPVIHSPGNNRLRNGVFAVYGKEMLSQLLPLSAPGEIGVDGYISKPQMARANRNYESYFLNGRYIRSKIIEKALDDAYRDYVVPGTYPVVVLMITMDPSLLDVNVHPTKMEVRFTEEDRVADTVYQAVLKVLKEQNLTATAVLGEHRKEETAQQPAVQPIPAEKPTVQPVPEPAVPGPAAEKPSDAARTQADEGLPEADIELLKKKREALLARRNEQVGLESEMREETAVYGRPTGTPPTMRLVGQVFRTYWIAEDREQMYIIDQHAAHERVLYDRLKEKLSNGPLDSQILLEPMVFTLPPRDFMRVMENTEIFARLGYTLEAFGENAVVLREVPYIFNGPLGRADFQTMVDLLAEGGRAVDQVVLIDRMAMISCKAAVKGNDAISFEEMESLLAQLLSSPNPYNCPHGRPTMMTMTKQELERRFKR